MFDYESLKLIWWLLVGFLLMIFSIIDGFELGVSALLIALTKTKEDRALIIDILTARSYGGQIWLLISVSLIFTVWPLAYSIAFSGFYWIILCVLLCLIIRPLLFHYRPKLNDQRKKRCDFILLISGALPSFLYGLLFGNLFVGYGFNIEDDMRAVFEYSIFDIFNPFAIFCGIVSLAMITLHGAVGLTIKAQNPIKDRAVAASQRLAAIVIIGFASAGLWVSLLPGYEVISTMEAYHSLVPLDKSVIHNAQISWLNNYRLHPEMLIAPCIAFVSAFTVMITINISPPLSFAFSALVITGVLATAGCSLFPFILPSATNPSVSLTIWDAASSELTLSFLTYVMAVVAPLTFAYMVWRFLKMWRFFKVSNVS